MWNLGCAEYDLIRVLVEHINQASVTARDLHGQTNNFPEHFIHGSLAGDDAADAV